MRQIALLLSLTACTPTPDPTLRFAPLADDESALLFLGDILLSEGATDTLETYGWSYAFEGLAPAIESAQAVAVVGNHEGPLTTRTERSPPNTDWNYGADPASATAFAPAGFTHMSVANNHALDRGVAGLIDTRRHLSEAGVTPFGGGGSLEEAHAAPMVDAGGTSVALLGTMHAWPNYWGSGWQADEDGGVLLMESGEFDDAVAAIDADLVVMVTHWGSTYAPVSGTQRQWAQYAVDLGVDAIVGHHSHAAQSFGFVEDVPVVWSVGNAAFGTVGRFGFEGEEPIEGYGLLARLVISGGAVDRWELLPIRVNNHLVEFRAVPATEEVAGEVLQELAAREGTEIEVEGGVGVMVVR